MNFCTAINCIDGRVQLPVINYLKKRFNAEYVDLITEAGVNLVLAKQNNASLVQSIFKKLKMSIEEHRSLGVGIVGHHDCLKNPAQRNEQIAHIQDAVQCIRQQYETVEIIGLWIDENLDAHEVGCLKPGLFKKCE